MLQGKSVFALEFTLIFTLKKKIQSRKQQKAHYVKNISKTQPLMPGNTCHEEAQLPHRGLVVTGFDLLVSRASRMLSDTAQGQVW